MIMGFFDSILGNLGLTRPPQPMPRGPNPLVEDAQRRLRVARDRSQESTARIDPREVTRAFGNGRERQDIGGYEVMSFQGVSVEGEGAMPTDNLTEADPRDTLPLRARGPGQR